jgi:hypothetical protein
MPLSTTPWHSANWASSPVPQVIGEALHLGPAELARNHSTRNRVRHSGPMIEHRR